MNRLQDGQAYRTPDGRVFRATLEIRRYSPEPAWSFAPLEANRNHTWLEGLEQQLFFEDGRLVYYDFSGPGPQIRDTEWTINDLVPVLRDQTEGEECPVANIEHGKFGLKG